MLKSKHSFGPNKCNCRTRVLLHDHHPVHKQTRPSVPYTNYPKLKYIVQTHFIPSVFSTTAMNIVLFLLGDSPAYEFYLPAFRNTLFHLHRWENQEYIIEVQASDLYSRIDSHRIKSICGVLRFVIK